MEDDIMVSVNCLVYNHEPYIRDCLEGFVNQKTNFKFEVLVHDDASTDGSAGIIREYEEKYPDIIKPVYQTENQYSQGIGISATYQYPRAKGKYYAECEGDDFWCDENKLQTQFDIMEANPNLSLCTHKVEWIAENGESLNRYYPAISDLKNYLTSNEFINILLSEKYYQFQTSSFFLPTEYYGVFASKKLDFLKKGLTGDYLLQLLLATKGDLYFIDKTMSKYRRFSSNSWSAKFSEDIDRRIKHYLSVINTYEEYDKYTNYNYHDLIVKGISRKEFQIFQLKKNYKSMLDKKYRKFFYQMSFKDRLYVFIGAKFRFLLDLYYKLKKSK